MGADDWSGEERDEHSLQQTTARQVGNTAVSQQNKLATAYKPKRGESPSHKANEPCKGVKKDGARTKCGCGC
jgi:hypothetical protein